MIGEKETCFSEINPEFNEIATAFICKRAKCFVISFHTVYLYCKNYY